jgi:hypothetical protein
MKTYSCSLYTAYIFGVYVKDRHIIYLWNVGIHLQTQMTTKISGNIRSEFLMAMAMKVGEFWSVTSAV